MKFPYSMLLDFVQTDLSAEAVGELLTMTGFELEEIVSVEGEPVLDVNIMSNRGDGASVFGLAREVLAKAPGAQPTELYRRAAARFPRPDAAPLSSLAQASVRIETEHCTRYACRVFEGLSSAPAPEWVQKRLRQAGQRPLGLLVDLTNYVMLELGQPLHAFDLDRLAGPEIVVRNAREGETLRTLDGVDRSLKSDQMMICDANGPVAAAGIMGGERSEVSDATRRMLLESAHFASGSVRRTRKTLGLHTEASYRFERSVDPEGVVAALNRFAELLEAAGGPNPLPGVIDLYPAPATRETLRLRLDRASQLLGMPIEEAEARSYLDKLGFEVDTDFAVRPPTWRPDIRREEDLIEELGRVHGYEKIPEALPPGTVSVGGAQGFEAFLERTLRQILAAGFDQTISHTLTPGHALDDPSATPLGPRAAGNPDIAILRSSTLSSLAESARRNGGKDLHLFEIGRVFAAPETEETRLGLWSHGALLPAHWQKTEVPHADFFSLKGTLEQSWPDLRWNAPETPDPRLHPTVQARLSLGGETVGLAGRLHPEVAERLGLPGETVVAEVSLSRLAPQLSEEILYTPLSRNPSVRRDIALAIARDVPYAQIETAIRKAAGEVLERQWLFDVYAGKGIPEGQHSLAIAMQLRKQGENFTDEEANQVRDRVVEALVALGATPR